MRLNRHWPEAELRLVVKQLAKEYPAVPEDVTALAVQLARLDVPPGEDPSALLARAREVLGRSVLLQTLQDAQTAPGLAMAS